MKWTKLQGTHSLQFLVLSLKLMAISSSVEMCCGLVTLQWVSERWEDLNPFRRGLALGILCQRDLRAGDEKHLTMAVIAVFHRAKATLSACNICSNKLCSSKFALSIVAYLISRALLSLLPCPPSHRCSSGFSIDWRHHIINGCLEIIIWIWFNLGIGYVFVIIFSFILFSPYESNLLLICIVTLRFKICDNMQTVFQMVQHWPVSSLG